MIQDIRKIYFERLNKLIRPINEEIRTTIYFDLLKLEDWRLPNLDELQEYFEKLDFDINITLWKLIKAEFLYQFHIPLRNDIVIFVLKFIHENQMSIKPFVMRKYRYSKGDDVYQYSHHQHLRHLRESIREFHDRRRTRVHNYEWNKQTVKEASEPFWYEK